MASVTFSTDGWQQGLGELWRQQQLCDVVLVTEDGAQLHAHRVCLAASSGYFRACLMGAGASMRGSTVSSSISTGTVLVPDADMSDLKLVVTCIYDGVVKIQPDNLERLLRLASFLEVPTLLDACAEYMRQVLQLTNAVPLLILAARYGCLAVRSELVSYICSKFSSLCVPPVPSHPAPPTPATLQPPLSTSLPRHPHPTASSHLLASSWPHSAHASASTNPTLDRIRAGIAMRSAPRQPSIQSAAAASRWPAWGVGPVPAPAPPRSNDGDAMEGVLLSGDSEPGPVSGGFGGGSPPGEPAECLEEEGLASAAGTTSSPLCALPKDLLLEVLHSDELVVDCELDVLQCVIDWAAEDCEGRLSDLAELMQAVRVEQLPASLPLALGDAQDSNHRQVILAAQALLNEQRARPSRSPTPDTATTGCMSPNGNPAITTPRTYTSRTPVMTSHTSASPAQRPTALQAAAAPTPGTHSDTPQLALPSQAQGLTGAAEAGALSPAMAGTSGGLQQAAQRRVHAVFGRPRRPQPTTLIAAGGHDASWRSLRLVEVYDPTRNTWSPGPPMQHSVSFAAGAHIDREVLVVGGTPLWSCVSRLVDSGSRWVACANLPSPRAHAGVVAAGGSLFVMGGRSQVQTTQQVLPNVEVFSSGTWTSAAPMLTPRSALAAVSLRGGLYAIGGQTQRSTLRTVERFDLGSETWTLLGSELSQERKYAGAAVLNGRIYLVGGLDEVRTRLSVVECLDPREGRWTQVAPLQVARSSAGVAALQTGAHGRLYAVGGSATGDGVHDSVEAWVPEMNKWVEVCPLSCGRSGLALCGL